MPRLQELITQLSLATVSELNRAIFSYPDSGLLDAFEQTFGIERAAAMRERIAAAADVPILADDQIRVVDGVLSVSALQLTPLVTRFKALPLRWDESSGEKLLVLVMADPLMEEAKHAFSQLFQTKVLVKLGREKAIMNAYALSSPQLTVTARTEASEHADSNLPSFAKHIEDPEVRKAIQQLIATAVKHNASQIAVDPANAFTRALFTFADGITSTVEISVRPLAVLASLFRRGQIVRESSTEIQVACRIRFKSVSVNFILECRRPIESEGDWSAALSASSIEFRNFSLDEPENPCFWEGLRPGAADLIREVWKQPAGLFILAADKGPTREFASRALVESYPDLVVADLAETWTERGDFWSSAEEQRVLGVLHAREAFEIIDELRELAPEKLKLVRGILVYHQLPRVCPFCAKHEIPETELLLKVPAEIPLPTKDFRSGAGCLVCEDRGILGFVGLSSVLDLNGYAGKVLRQGGDIRSVHEALAKDCFMPLVEDGLLAAGAGKIPFKQMLQELPGLPSEYARARRTPSLEAQKPESAAPLTLSLDMNGEHDASRDLRNSISRSLSKKLPPSPEPVRGSDVFLVRAAEETQKPTAEDHDWLFPPKEARPLPQPAKETAPADGKPLLLVIDDDADQRAILRRVFEIAGYRVEVAADGIDGIVSAVRLVPRLIIVDFMMPELDGRETIRRLKGGPTTGDIPVVALTAYADPDVELGLLQAGADDFCPKSVSKQVLLKRVQRLVQSRAAAQAR